MLRFCCPAPEIRTVGVHDAGPDAKRGGMARPRSTLINAGLGFPAALAVAKRGPTTLRTAHKC